MKKYLSSTIFIIICVQVACGQANFSENPYEVKVITKDVYNFWKAFDSINENSLNPFDKYIENGSLGLKGFMTNRIINADSLLNTVRKRSLDYEKSRNVLDGIEMVKKKMVANFSAMKYWYPKAKFPPIYFVMGRFNTAGTVSEDGIIIGTEMLNELDGITGLVSHELIHYQQEIGGVPSLLKQSILEGSADFIGELISGEHINAQSFQYGEKHQDRLCREFVLMMNDDNYTDWVYSTSGKDDRPNDLGYWIGYRIVESYFNKQENKLKAINDILNIKDPTGFLTESRFLDEYIEEVARMSDKSKEDLLRLYSEELYEVVFSVKVPNRNDEVYITGNQPELAIWNPKKLKLEKVSDYIRRIKLQVHTPAQFKFTRGNWESEAIIEGVDSLSNLKIVMDGSRAITYKIVNWKDRIE